MLRNYIKVAFRRMQRDKATTFINVLGLALGMMSFLLILNYVRFERSFDAFHENAEKLFRVESKFYKGDQLTDDWASSTNGYAPAMKAVFPEIESFTRYNWSNSERTVRYEDVKFREHNVCFADSNFFTFFNFPLAKGNPRTLLSEPNSIVLSETTARKYFGDQDPIGKILIVSTIVDTYHCMVTGIFKDIPLNSHLQFNLLMSWQTSPQWMWDYWYIHESNTYVRLKDPHDAEVIEAGFPDLAEQYKTGDALKDLKWAVKLMPLLNIHLNPGKSYELEIKGNRNAVGFLFIIAWLILLIAWINFINLSTAKSLERAKEAGLRKINGSGRSHLIFQFMLEAFFINLFALVLALALVTLGLKFGPNLMGDRLKVPFWSVPINYMIMASVFTFGVLLSGLYPALILSRIKPMLVISGKYSTSRKGAIFRTSLVVVQFMFSIILIAGTFVVFKQIRYMQSQDLGIDIMQTLIVETPIRSDDYQQKVDSFLEELKKLAGVQAATASSAIPGKEVAKFLANRRQYDPPDNDRLYETLMMEHDFIKTYDLEIIAGRDFERDRISDLRALILNESAVKQFGFPSNEEAINEKILLEVTKDRPHEIIGVIRDYHHQSLQKQFTPIILCMDPEYSWIPNAYFSIRMEGSAARQTVERVGNLWNDYFPESSFDFFFLDTFFARQYQDDHIFGNLFLLFSSLAIFIACMGLFGLSLFSISQRIREIGIRKSLGASDRSILALLNSYFVKLIVLSGVLAIPVSIWVLQQWLEGYAFRISPSWWIFVLPVLLVLIIGLLTVSTITMKAARTDPAKILKYE